MTPEQKAREEIDKQLAACGWVVQNHSREVFTFHRPEELLRLVKLSDQSRSKGPKPGKRRGAGGARKTAKRNAFEGICEGFDALKRRRDA